MFFSHPGVGEFPVFARQPGADSVVSSQNTAADVARFFVDALRVKDVMALFLGSISLSPAHAGRYILRVG